MSQWLTGLVVVVGIGDGLACGWAAENSIYESLISDGVKVSDKETVKLPQPALTDGLNAAERRKSIEMLLANRHSWEEFTRNAVVSPFLLKIAEEEEGSIGRRVNVYFVIFVDMKKLESDDLLKGQLVSSNGGDKSEDAGWVKTLTPEQLKQRGWEPPQSPEDRRFVAAEFTLLDKVRLSTFSAGIKSKGTDSVTIAATLATDKLNEFPVQWRAIQRDDTGRRQLGPPQPYTGMGAYLKATKLAEPDGAVFVEWHIAFAEPQGWFNGANLLRSKLPIVLQDAVRKIRREVAKK